MEKNGLDISSINPKLGTKYSPNLFKWLKKRGKEHRQWTSRVYTDKHGYLMIGYPDDSFFIGSNLITVLCNGSNAESFAICRIMPVKEVDGFWDRYIEVGRCAIDPKHDMVFQNDDERWETTGDSRVCRWCGEKQVRKSWKEVVTHYKWEKQ